MMNNQKNNNNSNNYKLKCLTRVPIVFESATSGGGAYTAPSNLPTVDVPKITDPSLHMVANSLPHHL